MDTINNPDFNFLLILILGKSELNQRKDLEKNTKIHWFYKNHVGARHCRKPLGRS